MASKNMKDISNLLKNLKFRKKMFGGIDEKDVWRKLDELQETMDALVEENPIKRDAMKLYITLQNVASTADVLRRAVMPFVSRRAKQ